MQIYNNFDLSAVNTLQLRSSAENYVEIKDQADLLELLNRSDLKNFQWKILGAGSNLILPERITGLVVKIANKGLKLISEDEHHWFVKAQAGENWHEFVQWTLQKGYWGLENLSLIPGTVGAAPIQNIGAYGVEVKDSLWEVICIDLQTGQRKIFSNSECCFSYRESFFKQEGKNRYLVWEVVFRLAKKNILHLEYGDIKKELSLMNAPSSPKNIADAVVRIRTKKLPNPAVIGNAGSFFKNPIVSEEVCKNLQSKYPDIIHYPYANSQYKLAAGWLIDRAGWKGKQLGCVGMYEKQALVLVNHGGATANDVRHLSLTVAEDVKRLFGVHLEIEPIQW